MPWEWVFAQGALVNFPKIRLIFHEIQFYTIRLPNEAA